MVLMVSYELRKPGQDYAGLYEELKNIPGSWWHYLTSHWLLDTTLNPQEVWERISRHVDKDDSVLVMRVWNNPKYSGWLPQKAWDWLNGRTF